MEAERLLKDKRLKIMLIPAPRALASDCGLAIRYDDGIKAEVEAALAEKGLMPPDVYKKTGETFEKVEV
jgi:hypothetical protein